MAERTVVQDPLAANPNGNASSRQLGQMSVSNPRQSGGTDWMENQMAIQAAVGKLASTIGAAADQANDDAITEGKLSYMQGVTEDEIYQRGNKYSIQGWESLNSASQANDFVLTEQQRLADGDYTVPPEQYRTELMERRGEILKSLPDDPAVRKMFVTQFDSTADQLIVKHAEAHNKYNEGKTDTEFSNLLRGNPKADPNAHRVMPGSDLRVSPGMVSKPIRYSAKDRDIGIRTILGEAGMEGDVGMAAVAHVIKNRAIDGNYGGSSIAGVSLAEKQFSTWNKGAGGNNPQRFSSKSNAYRRAGEVFDAVMAGRVQDMTGGATHYYSPKGMKLLVDQGSQSNLVPKWAKGKGARIGGHLFFGGAAGDLVSPEGKSTGIVSHADTTGLSTNAIPMPNALGGEELVAPPGSDPAAVKYELGVGAGPDAPPMSASYDILMNSNMLPADRKAKIAADIMIDDLSRGDDSSFTEMGGITSLQRLGLDYDSVSKVEAAYDKYKDKQANEFNVAQEAQLDELMQSVKRGDRTPIEAGAILDKMTDNGQLTEASARSIQQQYFNAAREGDDKFIESPQLQAALANIQIAVQQDEMFPGGFTLEEGIAEAQKLGKQYGIPDKKMEAVTQQLVELAKGKKLKAMEDIKKNGEKYRENQLQARKANTAISNGYGVGNLDGTIDITMDDGATKKMSLKQFAVEQIKASVINTAKSKVGRGGAKEEMTMEQASVWADREIHRRLKRQNVVDETQKAMVTSALNGNVVGANGEIKEDALQALDWYLTMSRDPSIGSAYAATYLDNPDAKALALQVDAFMGPGLSLPDAVMAANAEMQKPIKTDPNATFIEQKVLSDKVATTVGQITNTSNESWQGWIANVTGIGYLDKVDPVLVERNREIVEQRLQKQTRFLKSVHPNLLPDAAVKGAMDDAANDGVMLGGQIYFGSYRDGKRLDQVMGLSGDRLGPQKALDHWVDKYYDQIFKSDATGTSILAGMEESLYQKTSRVVDAMTDVGATLIPEITIGGDASTKDASISAGISATRKALEGAAVKMKNHLPHTVTYDARSGLAVIGWYDPKDGRTLLTRQVDLREVGKVWKDDTINNPSLFGQMTNKVLRGLSQVGGAHMAAE